MKPIIAASHGDEIVAWRAGTAVRAAAFLAEVRQVADGLPDGGHVLNLCADRYRFAVALCAAIVAGKVSLLPPNHSPELIERLRELYDDVYVVSDNDEIRIGLRVSPYPRQLEAGAAGHSITVDSKPYMCCGGTVPTSVVGAPGSTPSRRPSDWTL